jgi:hypothetical protein
LGGAPLMELEEAPYFGIWPRRLAIFEDRVEVRDFELLREKIDSKEYGWVDRVVVSGKGWFSSLLLAGREGEPVLIRGVRKDAAERAKALIEERMPRANGQLIRSPEAAPDTERLMLALTELRDAGVLSEEEFETKRKDVMDKKKRRR